VLDGVGGARGRGSFDPRLRETAGVAVGVALDNAYGVAFHSTVLSRLGVGESDIEAMRQLRAIGSQAGRRLRFRPGAGARPWGRRPERHRTGARRQIGRASW